MRALLLLGLFAAFPSSANFTLKNYDVGGGAGAGSSSNYQLAPAVGSTAGKSSSASYTLPAGVRASSTAAVPTAPTFTNPDNSYNRLHLTLTTTSFPSDTKYLIAISNDNFATTRYVQADQTMGSALSLSNYKTYSGWGGASGFWVLDLSPNTTYRVKVSALQGKFTGSGYGPISTAATVLPTATFSVGTGLTSTPPFSIAFSSLAAGAVSSANTTIEVGVTTNAQNGGMILINDTQSGLFSALSSFTLASVTGDLNSLSTGYGGQVTNVTQTSGGPLASVSPFNGSSSTVGALSTTSQPLVQFNAPITGGATSAILKAKATSLTPAASDYVDKITVSLQPHF